MILLALIRFLLIINVVHQGGVFGNSLRDILKKVSTPFKDVSKSINSWWKYGTLKAEDAKLCKNGETKHCVTYDFIVGDNEYYLYTSWEAWKSPQKLRIEKIDETIKNPQFDPNKKLIFLNHGFSSSYLLDWVQRAKNGLLQQNANVIALDCRSHADFILFANTNGLIPLAEAIGGRLGELIEILIKKGWSGSRIHIVGHSLGAHIAGFAAKYLKTVKLSVARITALDPAGIHFDYLGPEQRLHEDDADFVDCIFTNPGGLGARFPYCDANYFVNCYGKPQPSAHGIFKGPKSHSRVTELFTESIYPTHVFEAKKCDGGIPCKDVKPEQCSSHNETIKMGYPASPRDLGFFYVETNGKYPYSKTVSNGPALKLTRKRNKPKSHNEKKSGTSKPRKQKRINRDILKKQKRKKESPKNIKPVRTLRTKRKRKAQGEKHGKSNVKRRGQMM